MNINIRKVTFWLAIIVGVVAWISLLFHALKTHNTIGSAVWYGGTGFLLGLLVATKIAAINLDKSVGELVYSYFIIEVPEIQACIIDAYDSGK